MPFALEGQEMKISEVKFLTERGGILFVKKRKSL